MLLCASKDPLSGVSSPFSLYIYERNWTEFCSPSTSKFAAIIIISKTPIGYFLKN